MSFKKYWIIAVVIVFVGVPLSIFAKENQAPVVSSITAQLSPPLTAYSVIATDKEGDALRFEWAGRISCGKFTAKNEAFAWWSHSDHGPDACPHEEGKSHSGEIGLLVTDGNGNEVRCRYSGSLDGIGSKCVTTRSEKQKLTIPPSASIVDPCAKERKAEAEARGRSNKARAVFEAIDIKKRLLDELTKASRLAEVEARAAAEAAGGEWRAEATENGKTIVKSGWKKPGFLNHLGRVADKAAAKAKAAAEKALEAQNAFDAAGGEKEWQKARKEYEEAFDSWQKAADALARCLGEAQRGSNSIGRDGVDNNKVGVAVNSAVAGCKDGDTRPISSERKKVQLADLRSAKIQHESGYGDYFDIDGFVELLEYVQLGGKVIKQIVAFHAGIIMGALERVGMPDFLSYYETASDGMIEVIRKGGALKKRLSKSGDYWLEYPTSDYTAMCMVQEVCRKNKWKREKEFTLIRERGLSWSKTQKETVFGEQEVLAAITKLFKQLESKNRPALNEIEAMEKACK